MHSASRAARVKNDSISLKFGSGQMGRGEVKRITAQSVGIDWGAGHHQQHKDHEQEGDRDHEDDTSKTISLFGQGFLAQVPHCLRVVVMLSFQFDWEDSATTD